MNGDGSPDWGLCLGLRPPCQSNHLLMGIASSLVQSTTSLQVQGRLISINLLI